MIWDIRIRPAVKNDCRSIALLFRTSSGGVADYIWSRIAPDSSCLAEVGERRYAREGEVFSYQQCDVAEHEGRVVGMVHSYAMVQFPKEYPDEDADPVLSPYEALEEPGSLYISGMACQPTLRCKGLGRRLFEQVHIKARTEGHDTLSAIVFEENSGAMRFWSRLGFVEKARKTVVPHPMIRYGGDALLLTARV